MEGTRHQKPRQAWKPSTPRSLGSWNVRPANIGVVAGRRYYSPGLGRWTSRDPIGERGGANSFGFVAGDPCDRVDSIGLVTAYPGVPGIPFWPPTPPGPPFAWPPPSPGSDKATYIGEVASSLDSLANARVGSCFGISGFRNRFVSFLEARSPYHFRIGPPSSQPYYSSFFNTVHVPSDACCGGRGDTMVVCWL